MDLLLDFLRLDLTLMVLLLLLIGLGVGLLYSASGQSMAMMTRQLIHLGVAMCAMLVVARIPPDVLRVWTPVMYLAGCAMLVAVLAFGVVGKGAQRWLDLGFFRFQPSELMKLAVPMMVARYISDAPLPSSFGRLLMGACIAIAPALLVARQPDLGTALLIGSSGFFVLFLSGMRWRWLLSAAALVAALLPALWMVMRPYQRQRVMTLLNPESDPLGSGYHIIQSKIAIGSGGIYGKGWLNGTQSHLDFLPERHTDFIFAVFGEEWGLVGGVALLLLYMAIVVRCLVLASGAQMPFSRLLAGSLGMTFFVYTFVNVGMVIGLLPVVGVPLPLVSYGGTSMVTLMLGFGILMSVTSYKRLLSG